LGENLFVGFFYIEQMAGHVVENYSKSLQKLEDGIIRVQLAIRVIFHELKCLGHTFCLKSQDLLPFSRETGGRVASSE